MIETAYQPYIDPDYDSLMERMYPPRVCIDNETSQDCTLVMVDSANKHGILLEMVQVLTDLDLVISKSYISSDGGWFMDVFHVTDQHGNKITDESLMLYIQRTLCATRRENLSREPISRKDQFKSRHISNEHTTLEITGIDRPGLLFEISVVLAQLECQIAAAVAWTHNSHSACVIYMEDEAKPGCPITDQDRLAHIEGRLKNIVEARHVGGEQLSLSLTAPATGRTHTERRLHQLMFAGKDYERCGCGCEDMSPLLECTGPHVLIEGWKDKGYSVVNIRSRDRPKLLFDTVCALTDMDYVVSHAVVSSVGKMANQEYFIRSNDGCTLDEESEKHKLTQCLIAAIERRVSHVHHRYTGLQLDIDTGNRKGLLSDVTRVLREGGLSIAGAEIRIHGDRAIESFYVTNAAGQEVDPGTLELIGKEIDGSVMTINGPSACSSSSTRRLPSSASSMSRSESSSNVEDQKPRRLSLAALIWSKLERLSRNFSPIRL